MEETKHTTGIYDELKRKAIHLSSSVLPIFYLYNSRDLLLIILSVLLILSVGIDILRYSWSDMKKAYLSIFSSILRSHEKKTDKVVFTGATYLVLSALICVAVFPKAVAIMSILILTVSDSFAALAGKFAGKIKLRDKTLEGSVAFFLSGLGIIFLTPKLIGNTPELIIAIIVLFVTTVVEVLPVKFDDNILIPLFFGGLYTLLFNLFF